MNYPKTDTGRNGRPVAVLLTIVLHLALAYFLYTKAVQPEGHKQENNRTEQVEIKTP